MIYQQITLTLSEEQVQRIKTLNAKIFPFKLNAIRADSLATEGTESTPRTKNAEDLELYRKRLNTINESN